MAHPPALHELSPAAMRALYAFVHAPAQEADPQRLKNLLDDESVDLDDAFEHQSIRERLGLGDAGEFDPGDPLHRAALLPREALRLLARRLGLACAAPRLRRVIRRVDLAELGSGISQEDWHFILSQAPAPQVDDRPPAAPGLADLQERCRQHGWSLLERACEQLPPDIGKRLRLKLPAVAASGSGELLELSEEGFASVCVATAMEWDPDWQAMWSARPSS